MYKIWKRVLSFVLTVGMVVSLLVPTVGAGGNDKDFIFFDTAITSAKTIQAGQVMPDNESVYIGSSGIAVKLGQHGLSTTAAVGDWYAVKINVPAAGKYNVTLSVRRYGSGKEMNVYALPGSYASNVEGIGAALSGPDAMLLGSANHTVAATALGGEHTFAAGDCVIVFQCTVAGGLSPKMLTFEYVGPAVTAGKTEPSYFTYERRANALKNIARYSWAKELRDTAVSNAAPYLESFEAYYDAIMYEGLPRTRQLQLESSSDITKCQLCGCEVSSKFGDMLLDVANQPWKVQCPNCNKYFPTNDFESFYKLGLDASGKFDYNLAHKKNKELVAAGKPGYLVNTLYPEMGPTWGVDDGYGFRVYQDGTYGVMGTTAADYTVKLYKAGDSTLDLEKTALYIPYYTYEFLSELTTVITRLAEAYLYTGEAQYARAGAILLDGVADVYPSYDLLLYMDSRNDFMLTDGGGGYGKIMGRINDCAMGQQLADACDAFYPIIGDEAVLSFLSEKKGGTYTKEALWKNWGNNILLEIFNAAQKGQLKGNFGQQHAAVAAAAIILDEEPLTSQMIEWIYAANPDIDTNGPQIGGNLGSQLIDVVDRDGFGNEASPNYNSSWIQRLTDMANYLAMYQGEKNLNPYENPKFAQMVVAHASLVSADYHTVQIGDCSSTVGKGFQRAEGVTDVGFKYLKDTILGKQLADYIYTWTHGDLSSLSYGIFDADPTSIQADVLALVGDGKEQISELLPSYGFGILRDGQKTKEGNTLRDVWLTFGITASHAHADKLNLGMAAFGLNIAPEMGYPTNTGTNARRMQWEVSTICHNTVVVDQKNQDGKISFAGMNPYLFDDSDAVKVLGVDASNAYSNTDIYNRTVVMIKVNEEVSYNVDFFRVLGGSNHTFSFHSQSHNLTAAEGLNMIAQVDGSGNYVGSYAGANVPYGADPNPVGSATKYPIGYTWLKNVRKDTSVGSSFAVDFEISDYKVALENSEGLHLRMTQINNFDADEVAFVAGPVPARSNNKLVTNVTETFDYVLVQRKAAAGETLDSLFTTIYEPYRNERYLQSMVSVPVTVVSGTPGATDTAMAVKVTHENGRVDYVFYASNNEVTYRVNDLFNVCGYVGVYSVDANGDELYRYVSDGDVIVDPINTQSVYTGKVTGFSKDLVLDKNYIDVDLVLDSAAREKLAGKFIHVANDGVQNAIYGITAAEAIEGGTRLYTGSITLIRSLKDETDVNGGYKYNIANGQSFEIPLSYLDMSVPFPEEYKDKTYVIPADRDENLTDAVVDFPAYDWEYVNRSQRSVQIKKNLLYMDATGENQWFAIRIKGIDPTVGYKNLEVSVVGNQNGGTYDFYLLPGNTGNDDASIEAAMKNPVAVLKGVDGTVTDNYAFENQNLTAESYMLVFQCKNKDAGDDAKKLIQISGMTLFGSTAVAKIGDNEYESVEKAIEAAQYGETIVLQKDAEVSGDIMLPVGVKLDLNGKALTANINAALPGAAVIDSVGGGKLSGTLDGNGTNDNYLPVKSGDDYVFFKVTGEAVKVDNTGKMKFQVKLDKAGYDVLAAGTSGAEIGATFAWEGKFESRGIDYDENTGLAQRWGQEVADNHYADGYIVLSFTGLEAFEDLTVKPYIENAGVRISFDEVILK